MKAVYRERTITEQMDYILQGDRPVDYFLLNSREMERFIEEGHYTVVQPEGAEKYYTYQGIRIIEE